MRRLALLLATATLAACAPDTDSNSPSPSGERGSQSATSTPAPSATAQPALAVETEGLRLFDPVTGSSRPIAFGTARAQTLTALASRGTPEIGTNSECGAGPLAYASWPDGLMLWFEGDRFAGWALDDRTAGAIATAAGIGPGSTRADLDAAYAATVEQSTLGTEFATGELFGLIDGTGQGDRITNMWAGVSCNFR